MIEIHEARYAWCMDMLAALLRVAHRSRGGDSMLQVPRRTSDSGIPGTAVHAYSHARKFL
jgi:hypothetical protein